MFNLLKFIGVAHNIFMLFLCDARVKGNSPKAREKCEDQCNVELLISAAFPVEIATVVIISLIEFINTSF
jgi:hypothetical protein